VIVYSRAPMRISFAGGGTDCEPFCSLRGGCVISGTIACYAWVKMDSNRREYSAYPLHAGDSTMFIDKLAKHFKPVSLDVRVDAPHRSGLGGSGALGAATIGCLNTLNEEEPLDLYQIAELAYKVEHEEMGFAGGKQDQYAACFGGINYIEFGQDRVKVSRLQLKPEIILALERATFLVLTHPRSHSNVMEDEIRRVERDASETIEALDKQKELANETRRVLRRGDLVSFGELLDEGWNIKKKQTPLVTTERVEELYTRVKKAGALGGKLCGAGGGGYFVVFALGKETKVCDAILSLNLTPEPVIFDWTGLKVWQ